MSFQVYRYLAVGGVCFFINFCIFHLTYFFLLKYKAVDMSIFNNNLKSLIVSLTVTIPVGFYLNRNFVFDGLLEWKGQLWRYITTILASVYLSKILLDFFIIRLEWSVTLSFLLNIAIVQFVNFFVQKKISFKN
ncbi:GtrA family protein [Chryseobacterium sp. 52]|uniref:GtrA family protein n=1 Tax=Chryseobacterium sp. 52 TaxID=2035213 RepID=UPI0015D48B77